MRYGAVVGLALLVGATGAAVAQPSPTPNAPGVERLAADTPRTTSGGATFTAPAGWSIAAGNKTVLQPPEGDSHLALVEVQAADAAAAVAAGWASYRPDARR